MEIFKTYDIRGIFPKELNLKTTNLIGVSISNYCKKKRLKKIIIGYDARLSSKNIKKALISGLSDKFEIIDIGRVSSPMLYLATIYYKADLGIIITASHNPKNYNGFKICNKKGVTLYYGGGLEEIHSEFNKIKNIPQKKFKPLVLKKNFNNIYANEISKRIKIKASECKQKRIKIILDLSNGSLGHGIDKIVTRLKNRLKAKGTRVIIKLHNKKPDGNFPGHGPNPLLAMDQIKKEILKEKADFAITLDSDADRCLIFDNKGDILNPDIVACMLIDEKSKNHKIFYDLRCSKALVETIVKYKATPHKMRVGSPFYKQEMKDKKALIGVELSGHMMFHELHNIDDGLFAGIKFILKYTTQEKKLSEWRKDFEKYSRLQEHNISLKTEVGHSSLLRKLIENIERHDKITKIESFDGTTIFTKNYWINIRKSNTQPLIRINAESYTNNLEILKKIIHTLKLDLVVK